MSLICDFLTWAWFVTFLHERELRFPHMSLNCDFLNLNCDLLTWAWFVIFLHESVNCVYSCLSISSLQLQSHCLFLLKKGEDRILKFHICHVFSIPFSGGPSSMHHPDRYPYHIWLNRYSWKFVTSTISFKFDKFCLDSEVNMIQARKWTCPY